MMQLRRVNSLPMARRRLCRAPLLLHLLFRMLGHMLQLTLSFLHGVLPPMLVLLVVPMPSFRRGVLPPMLVLLVVFGSATTVGADLPLDLPPPTSPLLSMEDWYSPHRVFKFMHLLDSLLSLYAGPSTRPLLPDEPKMTRIDLSTLMMAVLLLVVIIFPNVLRTEVTNVVLALSSMSFWADLSMMLSKKLLPSSPTLSVPRSMRLYGPSTTSTKNVFHLLKLSSRP